MKQTPQALAPSRKSNCFTFLGIVSFCFFKLNDKFLGQMIIFRHRRGLWVTSSKSISICKDLRVLGSKNLVAGFGFKLRRKFLPEAPQHELLLRRLYHEECLLRSATLINCIHGWTIIFKIGTLSNDGETLRKTVIFRSNFFDVKIVWQYVIFWESNS